jgi:response regulator NasT
MLVLSKPRTGGAPLKILIGEDDVLEAQEMERLLRVLGHQVVAKAETGRRAVELARTFEPDLILLDIGMPGLDGIAAAQKILAAKRLPIVMVTGRAEAGLPEQAAAAGVFTYLIKPVDQRDLEAAILVACARHAELEAVRHQVRDLSEALELRKLVEQAKGILMHRLGISEAEAFRRLQRRAAAQRKPIREIAEAVRNADRFFQELEAE